MSAYVKWLPLPLNIENGPAVGSMLLISFPPRLPSNISGTVY